MKSLYTKILLDTNICIDLLVDRQLSTDQKKQLFTILLKENIDVFIPSCSIDTIYYILNSSMKIKDSVVKQKISTLLKYVKTVELSGNAIDKSLTSEFKDFEDALINNTAISNNIDTIMTFNTKDFSKSSLNIISPIYFIKNHIN